jgi:predicted TIM-barrel fold metal-dependent hydrolase
MCFNSGSGDESAAQAAAARANERADLALEAAREATKYAGSALIAPADSEKARRSAEERQRKILQSGGGMVPMPLGNAPVATQMLFGT